MKTLRRQRGQPIRVVRGMLRLLLGVGLALANPIEAGAGSGSQARPAALAGHLNDGRFGQAVTFSPARFLELTAELAGPYWAEARLEKSYLKRPLTVEMWIKLDSTLGSNVLAATGLRDFSGHWKLLTAPGTGELRVYLPGSVPSQVGTRQNVVDHQWHFIAMHLERTRARLYVDGILKADARLAASTLPDGGDGGLYIGAYPPLHEGCGGQIDDLRISNYIRPIGSKPHDPLIADAGTIGLWHFDTFDGGSYPDDSATANPAVLAPPPAKLALKLERGIVIDRQYHKLAPTPVFTRADIQAIKSMGFEFVKLIANPDVHKAGGGVVPASMDYLDSAIGLVAGEQLPTVVTIHPERNFKYTFFGNSAEFEEFLQFLEGFAGHLGRRWRPDQVALQLCTEPYGNNRDWSELQYRMWRVARRAMPGHTLILSGDKIGKPLAVLNVHPVNDPNVMYTFTTWDPAILTVQGAAWGGYRQGIFQYLDQVPYPASPAVIEAAMARLLQKQPPHLQAAAKSALIAYGNANWGLGVIDERFRPLVAWNRFFGGALKLWCGEFGAYAQAENPPADRYAFIRDVRLTFEKYGIGWAYWSYNDGFTVFLPSVRQKLAQKPDPAWRDQAMLDALFDKTVSSGPAAARRLRVQAHSEPVPAP